MYGAKDLLTETTTDILRHLHVYQMTAWNAVQTVCHNLCVCVLIIKIIIIIKYAGYSTSGLQRILHGDYHGNERTSTLK